VEVRAADLAMPLYGVDVEGVRRRWRYTPPAFASEPPGNWPSRGDGSPWSGTFPFACPV